MQKAGAFQFLCRATTVQDLGLQRAYGTVPCLQGAQAFPTPLKEYVLLVQCL